MEGGIYMSETKMSDQARANRAEYYREWRKRNPGKSSEYQRRYWQRRSQRDTIEKASDEAETEKDGD